VEYLVPAMNGSTNSGRGWASGTCCVKWRPRAAATRVVGGPAAATRAAGEPIVSKARPRAGKRAG
jgi:hypothetical protein